MKQKGREMSEESEKAIILYTFTQQYPPPLF